MSKSVQVQAEISCISFNIPCRYNKDAIPYSFISRIFQNSKMENTILEKVLIPETKEKINKKARQL